jgi:thymidylate synthase
LVLKGDTNIKYLQENGVKFGILGLIKIWVSTAQWRNWNSEEIDQITDLITELKQP